jgi:putative hydrolase of the HAD superfamily
VSAEQGPIDVVAFDLGGVLVDVQKGHLAALGDAPTIDDAFHGDAHDALSTGQLSGTAFAARAAGVLAVELEVARAAWARVVSWLPGGRALLSSCAARITTHVWSNTDPLHWSVLGPAIDGVVARVATSFALGVAKPDRRFFARALAGAAPERVLFVDDRLDNVEAARELGIRAVRCDGVDEARAILRAHGVDLP